MEIIIEKAKLFAQEIFASDSSGHDYHHTLRVHALARTLALEEGADVALVEADGSKHMPLK